MADPTSPPVIQRIAPGLVNFLQTKNLGRGNPLQLGETLIGVWDLAELYMQNEVFTFTVSGVAAGGVGVQFFTDATTGLAAIPDNELWYCHAGAVSTDLLGVGDTFQCIPIYRVGASPVFSMGPFSFIAANTQVCTAEITYRGWLPSSSSLGIRTLQMGGANLLDYHLRVTRFVR
jgi:hypothetical protein